MLRKNILYIYLYKYIYINQRYFHQQSVVVAIKPIIKPVINGSVLYDKEAKARKRLPKAVFLSNSEIMT